MGRIGWWLASGSLGFIAVGLFLLVVGATGSAVLSCGAACLGIGGLVWHDLSRPSSKR